MVQNPGMSGLGVNEVAPLELASRQRDPAFLMSRLAPSTLAALDEAQQAEVCALLADALPQPKPKIIDIRFVVNLIFDRYYVVLFMGKDQRRQARQQSSRMNRLGNLVVALLLLVSINLFVSLTLGMTLYLLKSAAGIDLFPGHLSDRIESL